MLRGPEAPAPKFGDLVAMLRAAALEPDQGLVFVAADETETFYSWTTIWERACRAAAKLSARGVRPGDRLAIILPTSIGFCDAFFGALLAGAVPVPLYPPVRLGRFEEYQAATTRMLSVAGAELVVIDRRVKPVLGEVLERAGCGFELAEALTEEHGPAAPPICVDPDTLGLIQFSSGSTVDPKAVALTHRQLLSQCAALHELMSGTPNNTRTGCSWLPLYHDMGLIGCLLSAAYYPGRLILIAPEHFLAKPSLWLRAIARHRAFISPAPNFAYSVCAKRIRDEDLEGLDLSCWSLALNGAEPVLPATLDSFTRRFAKFGFDETALLPVYGLSEAALAATFSTPFRRAKRSGALVSVGTPVPGFEVKIADQQGRELPDGEEGRILARGPSVMNGYFGYSGKAAPRAEGVSNASRGSGPGAEVLPPIDAEGWLDTGDLGLIKDCELYVTGRAKDIIIIRGSNHMPQEFEVPLFEIEGIRTGCVVALGETFPEDGGEGLLILAERASDRRRSDEKIIAEIVAVLVEKTGQRPSRVALLSPGTLPRTSSGKLRRAEALRRWRSGTLDKPGAVNVLTMSTRIARSALAYLRLRLKNQPESRR